MTASRQLLLRLSKPFSILLLTWLLTPWAVDAMATEKSEATDASIDVEDSVGEADESEEEAPEKKRSAWRNIVPIPIFITEPAIGEGLGLAVGYFHPLKSGATTESPPDFGSTGTLNEVGNTRKPPATVTGAFVGATNNDTFIGGVGHVDSFRNDTIRVTGVAAYADLFSTVYVLNVPFKFNLEGTLLFADAKFRIGESRFFWGIGASYLDADNEFNLDIDPDRPPLSGFLEASVTDVGLSGRVMYDTRDDTLMPDDGQLIDLQAWVYDQKLGGDFDYTKLEFKLLTFHHLTDKFVLGGRLQADWVEGDPPFYAVPWVTLRGIPALRYQGDEVATVELEGRYYFPDKWAAVAFGGRGWAESDSPFLQSPGNIYSFGVGGRYRVLEEQNVWVGIDIAREPEETYWYIQVGHPW